MSIESAIEVRDLVKTYKSSTTPAVDGISFDVHGGELFGFLGPNGAGKTTTISILTTTLSKTSGKVVVAGYDLDTQARLVRGRIGIIFQEPSLDLELTGEENIRLHVALYGLYGYRPMYRLMPAEYKRRVTELADVVGLSETLDRKLKTFSGGMRRKLEIVRSLMHRPRVLFLDEPTSGLDPVSRQSLWEYLQLVRQQDGTTVFLTTHYLDEAEGADRVCVLAKGHIATIGSPDQMRQQLVDRFVLVDADDRAGLRADLERAGLPASGEGPFRVEYSVPTAQSIIAAIRTPLSMLRVHEPSVEEAYVDLLSRVDQTTSKAVAA